ncbi:eukaryotic peptide chain release factor subunit 1 [Reticulomyxa filosa]|uniref:Eukaryotic peptide chain release factor subunit 1 n=1 Tax=Reticulomyxa filosa TaxID=46433 RepID=X6LKE5_RETFI|nr:eukaryotic peptide chain release factor subunit 1 [Reticulomyxa filosa]|eukprot:ETO01205.1 eukaryotic peptide chain release factor subunit 1 [Reticulomyxa filosa]
MKIKILLILFDYYFLIFLKNTFIKKNILIWDSIGCNTGDSSVSKKKYFLIFFKKMSKKPIDASLVEQWKIKTLIKHLSQSRGNGTSMISLVIPPKDQISRIQKMIQDEHGTASNIKSRVNRLSTDNGKEKKKCEYILNHLNL